MRHTVPLMGECTGNVVTNCPRATPFGSMPTCCSCRPMPVRVACATWYSFSACCRLRSTPAPFLRSVCWRSMSRRANCDCRAAAKYSRCRDTMSVFSTVATTCPFFTSCPSFTNMRLTTPPINELMSAISCGRSVSWPLTAIVAPMDRRDTWPSRMSATFICCSVTPMLLASTSASSSWAWASAGAWGSSEKPRMAMAVTATMNNMRFVMIVVLLFSAKVIIGRCNPVARFVCRPFCCFLLPTLQPGCTILPFCRDHASVVRLLAGLICMSCRAVRQGERLAFPAGRRCKTQKVPAIADGWSGPFRK